MVRSRSVRIGYRAGGVLAVALALFAPRTSHAAANGRSYETVVRDQRSGARQTVTLWIPHGIGAVRGALCDFRDASFVEREDYQRLAVSWRFALLGGELDPGGDLPASLGEALRQLADRSGNGEVQHLPLAHLGGGWTALGLARAMPERTLAVAMAGSVHERMFDGADPNASLAEVPVLLVSAVRDAPSEQRLARFAQQAEDRRLPWTVAPQFAPDVTGDDARKMIWPFLANAIEARLPRRGDCRRQPFQLSAVSADDAWYGDSSRWYTTWTSIRPAVDRTAARDAARRAWLLDEQVASIWRSYVARSPETRVEVRRSADAPSNLIVRLTGSYPRELRAVQFYTGKTLLGEVPDPPFELTTDRLRFGVHAVYAVTLTVEQERAVTRPLLLFDAHVVEPKDGAPGAVDAGLTGDS